MSLELHRSRGHRARRRRAPGRPGRRSASGSYLNWEGRRREFGAALGRQRRAARLPGARHARPSRWTSTCSPRPRRPPPASWPGCGTARAHRGRADRSPRPAAGARASGQAVLATWRQLLDNGVAAVDEPRAGRHGPATVVAAQRGHRGSGSASSTASPRDGPHRARCDHAAGGAGRPARRRRLAARRTPGLPRPRHARRRPRRPRGGVAHEPTLSSTRSAAQAPGEGLTDDASSCWPTTRSG